MMVRDPLYKLSKRFLIKLPYNDLDYDKGLHLREQSSKFIKPGINNVIVFDFSSVHLMDTHGLAAIMAIWCECSNKNIKLILCNLNESVLSVMKLKAIEMLIDIVQSVEEATIMSYQYSQQMRQVQQSTNLLDSLFGDYKDEHDPSILIDFKDKTTRKAS